MRDGKPVLACPHELNFTDDKEGLKRQIERRSQPLAAVELDGANNRAWFASLQPDRPPRREEPERKREHTHEI